MTNAELLEALLLPEVRDVSHYRPPNFRDVLKIDAQGRVDIMSLAKHDLVTKYNIPNRDFRTVDPEGPIPAPTTIHIRENALVVVLESLRLLIFKDFALLLSVPGHNLTVADSSVHGMQNSAFVRELVAKVLHKSSSSMNLCDPDFDTASAKEDSSGLEFELLVLDVALSFVTKILESRAVEMEFLTRAALSQLAATVNKTILARMRDVKNTLVKLLRKASRLKEEIVRILNDNEDMAEMYLTRRAVMQQMLDEDFDDARQIHRTVTMRHPLRSVSQKGRGLVHMDSTDSEFGGGLKQLAGKGSGEAVAMDRGGVLWGGVAQQGVSPMQMVETIGEVEDMLEYYYMLVENVLHKLLQLRERISDTESSIVIEQDHRRNELVALELFVNTITLMFAFVAMVGGIFGMNLKNGWEESHVAFVWVNVVTIIAGLSVVLCIMLYARVKRLLFTSEVMAADSRMATQSSLAI